MARRTNAIILQKLTKDREADLREMLQDLTGSSSRRISGNSSPSHWRRRFVASGKANAPKIRVD